MKEIQDTIKQLKAEFKMTVQYNPKIFVGMEIIKKQESLKLKQEEYVKKTLKTYGMEKANPVRVPIIGNQERNTPRKEVYDYRGIVGSLLYLSTKTRPDISYGVDFSSRYLENYSQENVNDVKHIMKYLNGTADQGLQYYCNEEQGVLQGYCDADFAGDTLTRRSIIQLDT